MGTRGLRHTAAALTLAALGGLGCGYVRPVALADNPLEHESPPPLKLYSVEWWKRLVTQVPLLEYAPREPARPAVDPDSHRVAAVTRDGFVRVFNADGSTAWSYQIKGPFFSTGAFREGVLYLPGGDGILYAFRGDTGEKLWEYDAGEELVSDVGFTSKLVLVSSTTNTLYAVDAHTGKWAWQYRRDMPSGFSIHGAATPVVRGDVAYVGFADGHMVALGASDGTLRWDRDLSEGTQFIDVDTTATFDATGHLYVASYKNGLFSLDPDTGETRWHAEAPGLTGLLLAGDLLIGSGDERVAAYSLSGGQEVWTHRVGQRAAFQPALAGGYLFVPTAKSLLILDTVTGRPLQSFDPGRGVTATPAISGPHVYVLSNGGVLYALRMQPSGR